MSNEDFDSGFTGHRFLVDAKDQRQYVVPFLNGSPTKPFMVYDSETGDPSMFQVREVVSALDEEVRISRVKDGQKPLVSTTAYQIEIGGKGEPRQPSGLRYIEVDYEVTFKPIPNGKNEISSFQIIYDMTQDSAKKLMEEGFTSDFPKRFTDSMEPNDKGLMKSAKGLMVREERLSTLNFPPHHPDGAVTARMNFTPETEDTAYADDVKTPATTRQTAPSVSGEFSRSSNASAKREPVKYRISDAAIEAVIKQFCEDLTEKAEMGKLDPVVGRDKETDESIIILSRRKQASVCFTGEAGVGKTAMFSAIAQRIADDNHVPESLHNARVLQLDLQAMNAGAKFRGQFEEKLKPLIDGLKEREGILKGRKIVLAIDEIHSQLTAGKAEGGTDSGNMMKPFLTAKGIAVMGTTTDDEYKKHIEKDGALASRFERKRLDEPDEASCKIIMERLWPLIRDHHHISADLKEDDFDYILQMSRRYAPNEAHPRKGEKVMDMAGASARFDGRDVVEHKDVIRAVAQMSGLSVDFLNQSDHDRFLKLEKELPTMVLGQPGLKRVSDGVIGARSGLNDPNQPWACFVFQGPTGTGKTEACKALARHLMGTEDALIKLDMGEYMEKHSVAKLIGAPPGYVGHESTEPALTEQIRRRPYSILLLDEIEKADPAVFNVLLPVLNDGKMKDNQQKDVLFNNVIVVMTTNAGAAQATQVLENKTSSIGFGSGTAKDNLVIEKELDKIYTNARLKQHGGPFAPEMINRIEELGGFINFRPLEKEVVASLVDRQIDQTNKRLNSKDGVNLPGASIVLTDEIKKELADKGYNRAMGARPLKKVVREQINNTLGKWLMDPENRRAVQDMVAENGAVKILIETLDIGNFKPKLLPVAGLVAAPAAAVNDNAGEPVVDVKKAVVPAAPKM